MYNYMYNIYTQSARAASGRKIVSSCVFSPANAISQAELFVL